MMADVRYYQHTAGAGLAAGDRIPYDKDNGGGSFSTRYMTGTQLRAWAVGGLGTAALLNVPASGDASSTEVVKGNDSRLTNARTPEINGLTAETVVAGGDFIALHSLSAGAVRKMTRANFVAGLATTLTVREVDGSPAVSATILEFNQAHITVSDQGSGVARAALATVNGNVGSFTNASITVDAQGRVTAAATGSATQIAFREIDGIPAFNASILEFDQDAGMNLTDQGSGVARLSLAAIPNSALATITAAGKVSDSALSSNVTLGGNSFTGTGSIVRATSPTLTTPTLGVAVATSVNGLTITTTTGTLTIGNGKTATINNSITFAGTDSTTQTFPNNTGTVANLNLAQTFTATQAFAAITASGTIVQTSNSGTAFESGPNGGTNPVFRLVNNGASAVTGLSITGNAVQGGVTLRALSSGTDEGIALLPKGNADGVAINSVNDSTSRQFCLYLGGTFTPTVSGGGFNASFNIGQTLNARVGVDAYGFIAGPTFTLNKAASGTHNRFATFALAAPTISGGAANLTNAMCFYVDAAPSGATNNYAFYINSGLSFFGGDIAFGTSTGTKIGTATTQKLGFYNATPIVRPSAYTQTYSTADKTHANFTSADLATTAATQTTPWGFASQAQAEAIATQFNALRADVADLKQLANSLIDDLQALGLVG